MISEIKDLLTTIDNRIRKILKETPSVIKYPATVVEVINDDWCKVKISGYDTVFTMANVSLTYLSVGDSVYVETVNGKMNTGVVKQRFNTLTLAEKIDGVQYHAVQKNVIPIGGVTFLRENLISGDAITYLKSHYGGEDWRKLGEININTNSDIPITASAYLRRK